MMFNTHFMEIQAAARNRALCFALAYLLAIMAIIPLVYLTLLAGAMPLRAIYNFFKALYDFQGTFTPIPHPGWWNPVLFAVIGAILLPSIIAGGMAGLNHVAQGGQVIAGMLGGLPVSPGTTDPVLRRLLNIVEEMAIAAGIPVPRVYLLREQGINVFSAGITPDTAVIGVTRGSLEMLTRDQLQALIAHGISHIRNGNTGAKTLLFGLLNGIDYPWKLAIKLMHAIRHSELAVAVFGVAFVVLAIFVIPLLVILAGFAVGLLIVRAIGVAVANVLKRMHSRALTFHADAAAVQFTRNAGALVGVLKIIGGYGPGAYVFNLSCAATSQFFFAQAFRSVLSESRLFSSHPALASRVRRFEPGFSGNFPFVASKPAETPPRAEPEPTEPNPQPEAAQSGAKPDPGTVAADGGAGTAPATIMTGFRRIGSEQLVQAAGLLAMIPPALAEGIRHADGARHLIYTLLMSNDPACYKTQLETLKTSENTHAFDAVLRLRMALNAMPDKHRIPLANLAARVLKDLDKPTYARFRETVAAILAGSGPDDRYATMLHRMLIRHLDKTFTPNQPAATRQPDDAALKTACGDVLSCLAYWGTYDIMEEEQAYRQGMERFLGSAADLPDMIARDACTTTTVNRALDILAAAAADTRERILDACVTTIAADGQVTVQEEEMLQLVADALGYPVPPIPLTR